MAEIDEFAEFCGTLTLTNGKRMRLEPFQRRMLGDYFAGVRELVCVIPKKNGKTTLLSALALFHLTTTDDADCVIVANSAKQAMKLFDEAKGFVQRSPELLAKLRVLRGYKEIRKKDPDQPDNPKEFRGVVAVLAADADTADGWGGTLALVDELHRQPNLELYGVLHDGLSPRAGQMITISTAGETEDSPLGELRQRGYAIEGVKRDGAYRYVTNGAFSLHEWALEPDQDREDLKLVKTANPAPWQTIPLLRERRESPSMTDGRWARFACGVWGLGGDAAFDRQAWDELALPEQQIARDRKVTLGFDGARRQDTTALVVCDIETGHLQVAGYWPRPFDADEEWEIPEADVREAMTHAFGYWDVWKLYADPPYWDYTVDFWSGEFGTDRVNKFWTNVKKMTGLALKAFKEDMVSERMSHDGDPRLAEHIGNAIRIDTNMMVDDEPLWYIQKDSRKSPRKIDLAMAAMLAWKARGDAIEHGVLNEPVHARASW
jgi:phage terminase large subunit-like protein